MKTYKISEKQMQTIGEHLGNTPARYSMPIIVIFEKIIADNENLEKLNSTKSEAPVTTEGGQDVT